MKGRLARWAGAVALAAAIVLAVPAQSLATGTYVVRGGYSSYAVVRGTHGFKVKFAETDERRFRLTVKGHHATTIYATRGGAPRGGRISVDLGRRGSFHLRFEPIGRPRKITIPSWCDGRPGTWRRGYLVGSFRFRGERDFTRVGGVRVPAAHENWWPLRCHYATGEGHAVPRARVNAWSQERHRSLAVGFGAALYRRHDRPPPDRVRYDAWTAKREGRLFIEREIAVTAPESTVAFPGGRSVPEDMTMSPPAPFTGTAAFTRTPESTFTWTGDLAVEFPGLGPIRLTGPGFGARVCALEGCVDQEPERESQSAELQAGKPR